MIGLAFLAVGIWFRKRPWYRARVVVPGSTAISLTGPYWLGSSSYSVSSGPLFLQSSTQTS